MLAEELFLRRRVAEKKSERTDHQSKLAELCTSHQPSRPWTA
jgi:hypothetical protein